MLSQLDKTSSGVHWRVVDLLGKLDPPDLEQHAARVHAYLAHEDESMRRRAVELLGKLDPQGLNILEVHCQIRGWGQPRVRQA